MGAGAARGQGLHAGGAARAGARAGPVRHRHAARHRAADLPRARGRAVPGRHLGGAAGLAARRRDPRAGRAAAPLRRASPPASGARRAPPARTRRASSACTSSTRSRCSASSSRSESGAEHERLLAIEEEILQALGIPYRVVNIAAQRPGRLGRQEVRPRGVAARAGALPRAHLVLEHHRLPGAPPGRAPPARGGRVAAATCTRSTARPWRSAGRSSRSRRTTSATTAPWTCPRCCTPFGAPGDDLT